MGSYSTSRYEHFYISQVMIGIKYITKTVIYFISWFWPKNYHKNISKLLKRLRDQEREADKSWIIFYFFTEMLLLVSYQIETEKKSRKQQEKTKESQRDKNTEERDFLSFLCSKVPKMCFPLILNVLPILYVFFKVSYKVFFYKCSLLPYPLICIIFAGRRSGKG